MFKRLSLYDQLVRYHLTKREAVQVVREVLAHEIKLVRAVKDTLKHDHRNQTRASVLMSERCEHKRRMRVLHEILASARSTPPGFDPAVRDAWIEGQTLSTDTYAWAQESHWFYRHQTVMEQRLGHYMHQVRTGIRDVIKFNYSEILDAIWSPVEDPEARAASARLSTHWSMENGRLSFYRARSTK